MRILDALKKEAVISDLQSVDKKSVLEELSEPVSRLFDLKKDDLVSILMQREHLGSTGIGGGIGIPHGKLKNLDTLVLGFGLSRRGVDFESMDGRPTHIFFLLVTPENSTGLHLKLLARISRILKNDPFKAKLMNAGTSEDLIRIIADEDEEF
ncbi:MAG: PTS sugar transporter subunit IIA [Desulfobacterales bacterium]|nr:PTS sugar transporter subunit IIA [Desulfobacterales bacterium]